MQATISEIHQSNVKVLQIRNEASSPLVAKTLTTRLEQFDALKAEEWDAEAQERELGTQRERLLAFVYPDVSVYPTPKPLPHSYLEDDETLFSVDNKHLEKQVCAPVLQPHM